MADTMQVDSPVPKGTKRKAEDAQVPPPPKRIKALDQDVINKIAAGEIIVAPMHALKELIENAVDAGSTSLEISVKDGGLKLLQITDNGHGINKDDLPILCERFTTSKLKAFEDLTSIATYGFRGEALASISHIAHLTITTKTADSSCAWRAYYMDGKLAPPKPGQSLDPKPTAGRPGTQITVEDLFYNVPQRRKAFKSPSEEYAKILDVVGRYAVHCASVAFSCKKHGESSMSISVAPTSGTIDRIRQIHGSAVANELIEFKVSDEKWGFKASGWATNANYHVKKTTILLFINHRSVESSAIKAAIQRTYNVFLPKGGHPFVYLSLEIDPARVDVNVHPTKREVNFLNEDEIIEIICDAISTELSKVDTSRTFMTQSLLPGSRVPSANISLSNRSTSSASKTATPRPAPGSKPGAEPKPYENNLVRTDPSLRKITSMLRQDTQDQVDSAAAELEYTTRDRPHMQIRLSSVKDLRSQVRSAMHGGLTEVFATHTYVGMVDTARRIVAIQSGVKLYLVDYGMICNEYFYQIGLTDFGNFGTIEFEQPLDIRALIKIAADTEAQSSGNPVDLSQVPERVANLLIEKREMVFEYFNLGVSDDGQLTCIPLLVKGYMPSLAKLPRFLMRLGPCVNWVKEKDCFETFLTELASFYTPEQLPNPREPSNLEQVRNDDDDAKNMTSEDEEIRARREQISHMLEHVLFPAFKGRLVATKGLLKGVVEVANLKGLYRVFERC